ncbi:hypothetical protein HMI55_001063 [Coelomomyces lativittatus]|nr:hypothetical protein HMI55_001063 [Coelomomyces lativittatus]
MDILKAGIQELEEQLALAQNEKGSCLSERLIERPFMFSGTHDDFRSFKNSIHFFFEHLGDKFSSSETKCSFIVRYLKGNALVWYEMVKKTNPLLSMSCKVLMEELECNFGPHIQAVAVCQELISLRQNENALLEFLPHFRGLAIASGVEDKMLQQLLCNAIHPLFQNNAFHILPMAMFEEFYIFLKGIALRHSAFHQERMSPVPILSNGLNIISEMHNSYLCGHSGHIA